MLSSNALRTLLDDAALHLANSWRELPADAWGTEVRTAQGRAVPAAETVWMRAREVWLHAIDLDNGANVTELPADFVDRLLPEIVELWSARGDAVPNLLLRVTDRDGLELRLDAAEAESPTVLTGSAAQLLAWAAGWHPVSNWSGVSKEFRPPGGSDRKRQEPGNFHCPPAAPGKCPGINGVEFSIGRRLPARFTRPRDRSPSHTPLRADWNEQRGSI